jgi:hypothetical protein
MARKKNEWTVITFDAVLDYIRENDISLISFARSFGITNSTVHNWKSGAVVPSEETQRKLLEFISGNASATTTAKKAKKKTAKKAKKTKKKAAKKNIAEKVEEKPAETLDDLKKSGSARATTAARRAKPSKKSKAAKKKTKRGSAGKPRPTRAPEIESVAVNGAPTDVCFLVSRYLDNHKVSDIEEYGALISTVASALS